MKATPLYCLMPKPGAVSSSVDGHAAPPGLGPLPWGPLAINLTLLTELPEGVAARLCRGLIGFGFDTDRRRGRSR